MPPKSRELRSAAPSASPAPGASRSSRSRSSKTADSDSTDESTTEVAVAAEEESADDETAEQVADAAEESADQEEESVEAATGKLSMSERMEKMKELRSRMITRADEQNQSTAANRKDLIADHQKSKVTAKELARLEKQRKLAQTLRLKAEAEEDGVDMERKKNWEWSIEQNERWQAKVDESKAKADSSFHNAEDDAFKRYNRNIKTTKPDLLQYQRAKESAMGLAPGTLVGANATNQSLALAGPSSKGLTASEDLYRGADTLAYGDNKPSEDAIDRVTSKINQDVGKKKRKAKDDSNEPVTYINERNKVFNKKVARYFDKYTKEIRASFERGTAL